MPVMWSDGKWIDASEGFVAMHDRGVLHGLGAFETMLAIDGTLQHGELHLRRLKNGIDRMGLRRDLEAIDVGALAREICEKNSLTSGKVRVRLTVTAGEGALEDSRPGSTASAWLTAAPISGEVAAMTVVILPFTRNENSALSGLKTTSYAENLIALRWARERGADEGIFFNNRGELCEACTANVFVKIDGHWLTPRLDSGCLPGVMRELVLERDPGIREAVITREQFARAEEMFLTSAIRGVVPARMEKGGE